jgi:cell division protein FtsB
VASAVLVAVLLLFVFPTRTYLDQRHQLATASERLRVLSSQNAGLSARIDQLHTDTEIERIAREQYHLVRPGETAFAILPSPAPTTTTVAPAATPAGPAHPSSRHPGILRRVWERLTSWL